ncbi:MAG: carboxypeptidase-like regulatory domain-containing protein, partial [Flavobacteriales bacterium]
MPAADKAPSLKLLFLVLALFAFAMDGIYAQSIQLEIIVSNSQDQQPLPFCNLYLHHHGIGQSTNHQGKAILNFKPSRKQDTLSISFIGFEPKSIPVDLQKSSSIEIKLEPSTHLLNAAIVKYVKPPHPKSILKKAIRKTDENYPTGNNLMEGYYRETIKEDGKFIQFNDAQVELFYTGYPNKNLDRKQWQDWFHDDRYVFDLEANSWFYELLHDFNHPDDRMAIKASRSSENWSKHQFETVLMGGPLSLTSLDKIKYQYDFLNPDLLNNYNLKLEGEVNQNGTLCYLIRFHPKESNKRFRIDQSRKNKRAIYIGEIFIEKSSFAVVKFSYQLAVDRDYGFFAKRMPLANSTEVNYARSEDFWFLHSVTSTEKKVFKRFEDGSVLVHEGTKFLRIDQLTPTEKSPFTEDDVFKSTLYSTLRYYRKANRPQVMQEWFSENGMKINEQVVKYLSTTTALDSQFIHRYLPKKDLPRPNPLDFGSKNDDFIWMKDPKKSEDLIGYLNLENTYAKNFLLEERAYQQSLYNSLNKFYKTPEKSSATRSPGDLYYDQDSLNFTFLYEYVDSTFSTPIFNLSAFRDAHPDAYYIDPVLNESKTQVLVQFKLPDELNGLIEVHTIGDEKGTLELNKIYSIEWLNDSTLVSAHANDLEQSNQLYQWNTRSNLGE